MFAPENWLFAPMTVYPISDTPRVFAVNVLR